MMMVSRARFTVLLRAALVIGTLCSASKVTAQALPEPPTDLFAASVVGNVVRLQWHGPPSAPILTGYRIEGGTSPGEVAAILLTGSSRPAVVFEAPTGVFYVRVRAMIGDVLSGPSNEILLAVNPPLPPSVPEGLAGLVNGSSVTLSWRNTALGGVPGGIALDVTGSAATTILLPAGDTFTFDGVPPGTYSLAVRALNTHGSSAPSNSITLSFPGGCSGVPAPPEQVRIYKASGQLFVYWQPAATGAATTGYVLRVSGSYVGAFTTTARMLSGFINPGTYHISLAGTNACGEGAASPTQTVTVP